MYRGTEKYDLRRIYEEENILFGFRVLKYYLVKGLKLRGIFEAESKCIHLIISMMLWFIWKSISMPEAIMIMS